MSSLLQARAPQVPLPLKARTSSTGTTFAIGEGKLTRLGSREEEESSPGLQSSTRARQGTGTMAGGRKGRRIFFLPNAFYLI